MDDYSLENTLLDLKMDMEEQTPVKLDLKVSPWQVVGLITNIGLNTFRITNDTETLAFLITDIQHYRLA